MTEIRCRFAPSPTGYLHIGGARTAIINYLHTQKNGGKLLLRIEDTDVERNKPEYIQTIYDSLKWLGISFDEEVVIQSHNIKRHIAVAHDMLSAGTAYRCFCTVDDLANYREHCITHGLTQSYSRKCRSLSPEQINKFLADNIPFTIRLKIPSEIGYVTINDKIKGKVSVSYDQLDDFILLRSDGTPVYMLSVVVDDHDMRITDIYRGDDHFSNTFRQYMLYHLNGWNIPKFGHLPLIHGADGKKLSKRLNAVGTDDYKKMGYLAESLKIYLATMGTSTNVTDSFDGLVKTFKIEKLAKSATQFDENFLALINQKVMKKSKETVIPLIIPFLHDLIPDVSVIDQSVIERAYLDIVSRSKTLIDCANLLVMYYKPDKYVVPKEQQKLLVYLQRVAPLFNYTSAITIKETIMENMPEALTSSSTLTLTLTLTLTDINILLRNILTGKENCPSTYNILYALGKERSVQLILDAM